jgi:hypothetical protein
MPFIIGGVIAGVVISILVVAGILLWCRRTRKRETEEFEDVMWRRQSSNLFFSAVTPPSKTHVRDPSLSTSRIPAYPFHEKYSGYGSSDIPEPVSIPRSKPTAFVPTQPTPLYQSFTVAPPPVITTTPPSPTHSSNHSQSKVDTTRQVELKRQIFDLQKKIGGMDGEKNTDNGDLPGVAAIQERIEFLQGLLQSPWALGQTAVVPDGVYL